jgi:CRISPR/Cas system-associated exonuclease Cas4 (RecB family)
LQIMGMLETRCLDFRNIIVLGMNEGILPTSASGRSYVPYAIRKAFGMPVAEQQEGVFAYHFYRLLHRAERVVLVYNSVVDPMSAGEPSRFIRQLKYELVPGRPHIQWQEQSPMVPFRTDGQDVISVRKSPEIMAEIHKFLEGGEAYLSPSSISNYIGCPLRFYFERIGRLTEQEEPDEAMDAIRLGNIFHDTLEELYKPYEGRELNASDIGKLKQQFPDVLKAMYRKHYDAHMAEAQGANVLNYTFLLKAGEELLDHDARQAPFEIVGVEKTWEGVVLDVPLAGNTLRVRVEGKFDRLDKVDGITRIIDYKSGTVDLKPARVSDPGPLFEKGEEKATIQTLTYALMYLYHHPEEQVHVGVYPLRTIRKVGLVMLTEKAPLNKEEIRPFKAGLQSKLAELFNQEVPFYQTENVKLCEYCNFRDVCER